MAMLSELRSRVQSCVTLIAGNAKRRMGDTCRSLYEACGGDATVLLLQQILMYIAIGVVVACIAALLVLASFGVSFLLAFATRAYVLYDLPVSSVHEISDWTAASKSTEPWRHISELNRAVADASAALVRASKEIHQRDDGASAIGEAAAVLPYSDRAASANSIYGQFLEARLKAADQLASSVIATAVVRIQPTGWRTRNSWNVPLDDDLRGPNAPPLAAEGDERRRRDPAWFVNDDALFLPQGPRFSQTASYTGSVRAVAACSDISRSGALLTTTAYVLIAEDDMPQPLQRLSVLFSRSRAGVLPGQGYIVYFARWSSHIVLFLPSTVVDWLSSAALWWASVDQASRAVNMLAPDECMLDFMLYSGFAPPKDLLQRLRAINLTITSSSTEPNIMSAPVQLRRLFYMHDVEHFGLAYYFSEYPLLSLWIATIVWFAVCVSFVAAGIVTVGVLSYQYRQRQDDDSLAMGLESSLAERRDGRPASDLSMGRGRTARRRNDWASGDEDESEEDAELSREPGQSASSGGLRTSSAAPQPKQAGSRTTLRKRAVSVR